MNKHIRNLNAIDTVQDLSYSAAAAVQGGALEVYTDADFQGQVAYFSSSKSNLLTVAGGRFHDTISSIRNNTNNGWYFNTDVNFEGSVIYVAPGQSISYVGSYFNDKFSSIEQVNS